MLTTSPQGVWSTVAPYVVPPVAAATAFVPVFYGLIAKSAQQLGNPIPSVGIKEALKAGISAAPTVGVIVGTQMVVQNIVEKPLEAFVKDFALMLMSSVIVGGVSAPALAVFNGQTMGRTVQESLRSLSAMQTCAIIVRETSFLFSLRVSGPIADYMERTYGKNEAVEYGSTFTAGAIGSLIGHPADTALTLWQKGRKVEHVSQLMRGGPMKAVTIGGFSIGYKQVKDVLNSKLE